MDDAHTSVTLRQFIEWYSRYISLWLHATHMQLLKVYEIQSTTNRKNVSENQ